MALPHGVQVLVRVTLSRYAGRLGGHLSLQLQDRGNVRISDGLLPLHDSIGALTRSVPGEQYDEFRMGLHMEDRLSPHLGAAKCLSLNAIWQVCV
jgi:hypothetical protein